MPSQPPAIGITYIVDPTLYAGIEFGKADAPLLPDAIKLSDWGRVDKRSVCAPSELYSVRKRCAYPPYVFDFVVH